MTGESRINRVTHLLVLLAILLVDGSSHWTTNAAHGIPPIPQATDTEKTPV